MKGTFLFWFCIIAVAYGKSVKTGNGDPSQAKAICAALDSDGILVAHENCNWFNKCFNEEPVALRCPSGLLYNIEMEWCDWPHNVACGDRIIVEDSEEDEKSEEQNITVNDDPSQAPAICATENSNGVMIAHENCNQYYKCFDGLPWVLNCQPNLLYNPEKLYCDWPYQVDCGDRIIPEIDDNESNDSGNNEDNNNNNDDEHNVVHGHDDPSEAPAICDALDSEGVLVAHEHCNKFYKCNGGIPVTLKCPADLLYYPPMEWCDWPRNVDCGSRVIVDDSEKDQKSEEQNIIVNDDPSQAHAICAQEDSNGDMIAHENCGQYYKCFDGLPWALDCPPNFWYNPEKLYCDFPKNVDCGDRIIPEFVENVSSEGNDNSNNENDNEHNVIHGHDDPSQARDICAAADSDGVLVAHENCAYFYKCSGGRPVSLICPSGLLYNPKMEWCDWPINVTCGDRIIE